jgi:6-phosphogluconolactonase
MKVEVYGNGDAVALGAARLIAHQARESVATRGKFVMAVSGGKTPWIMLRNLAEEDVPWDGVHVVQVDERVAPDGDPDRNLTHLRANLLEHAPLRPERIYAMPVESGNIDAACAQYATTLKVIAGTSPVLDLIHLGLGPDGHTASLVPGDPVLQVKDADVAVTGIYQKRRRMTLTYPIINRARFVLWLVTGNEKAGMLPRLIAADSSIPAGRVSTVSSLALADSAAAAQMDRSSKTEVA